MTTDVHKTEVHDLLARFHSRCEVSPYFVVWDQRPEGAPPVEQRVQAGFSVNIYAALEKYRMPRSDTPVARTIIEYFESLAQDVQSAVGNQCTVDVIPHADSLVLDTKEHLQPEAVLEIRISHQRGLDQPAGPSEQRALKAIREALEELGIREA